MCGILAYIKAINDISVFTKNLQKLDARGPDKSRCKIYEKENIMLGFTRLTINDLTMNGMQPMTLNKDVWLICNGEIFNHKELQEKHGITCKTKSDCEIILHLYEKLSGSFKKVVACLDGEFAMVLYDHTKDKVYATRDRYGVRPLFVGQWEEKGYGFSSEVKAINEFHNVTQIIPGTFMEISISYTSSRLEYHTLNMNILVRSYNLVPLHQAYEQKDDSITLEEDICASINQTLNKAVEKRLMSDRPICCLLSGGLDSSLIAALVAKHYPEYTLKTFSIGFKGSPDLHYANIVAKHIKSIHYCIELSEEQFLENIRTTIKMIESYDTTTVRASVGNMLIAKFIKENTDCKVVFNGDYSDEVCGGYKYFYNAPDPASFHEECKRLVSHICYFDSLRSDRSISGNGLEARVPFADNDFVSLYQSIPPELRMPTPDRIEKYLLRKAFDNDKLLPDEILWRKKEAFSDGVSKPEKSWHKTIQEYVDKLVSDDEMRSSSSSTLSKESFFYKKIFDEEYPNKSAVIPYYWMPKWCGDVKDPSAREI